MGFSSCTLGAQRYGSAAAESGSDVGADAWRQSADTRLFGSPNAPQSSVPLAHQPRPSLAGND